MDGGSSDVVRTCESIACAKRSFADLNHAAVEIGPKPLRATNRLSALKRESPI